MVQPRPMVLKHGLTSEPPGSSKTQASGLTSKVSDVVDLRWGLRISIYVKFPSNAVAIGPPLKIPDL